MLTRMKIKNFKRFEEVDIPLDRAVVFIGPNNSGKSTALQALALWNIGVRQWLAKRGGKVSPEKRPGVTINRRDLISIPVPAANMLWRDLHVRNVQRTDGKPRTQNIRIDIEVHGVTEDIEWSCGMEFDYSNEESLLCRPLRLPDYENVKVANAKFQSVPDQATNVRVAYLPPMSGLTAIEPKLEPGRINVLMGEGQTAQVLRNLCYQIYDSDPEHALWQQLVDRISSLFNAELLPPMYLAERGEITMAYQDRRIQLDISCSGRGMQQTLLLLAHLYANPGTVLLLDEPDAHLEILRQRQIYGVLSELTKAMGSQIIAASHSEVVLSEAAMRDLVVAFVGKPHKIADRGSQVLKSLTDIGFDQYYQAEQKGWMLFLEAASDLAILQAFASALGHEAAECLAQPFVHYVATNLPQRARDRFFALREAKPDLVGIALFDRLDKELQTDTPLMELMWHRREIENYFCVKKALLAYAASDCPNDLFGHAMMSRREQAIRESITEVSDALETLGQPSPWSPNIKASDDFLDQVFRKYFKKLDLPLLFRKANYHELIPLVPVEEIDPEVTEKLDAIVRVAKQARPAE